MGFFLCGKVSTAITSSLGCSRNNAKLMKYISVNIQESDTSDLRSKYADETMCV